MIMDAEEVQEFYKAQNARKLEIAQKKARGPMSAAAKRSQIREKLIPRWERVVFDGRDEAYIRRTTPENARLFLMWRDQFATFEQMIKSSYQVRK